MPRSRSLSIFRYLVEAERREQELFYVEDVRLAQLIVLYARREEPQPFNSAFLKLKGQTHRNALRYWARAEAILQGELARDTWKRKPPQSAVTVEKKKRSA